MTPLRRGLLVAGAAVVLVIVGLYLAVALRSGATAAAGTTVGGVGIGGMTVEEAEQAVTDALGPVSTRRLRVVALDQTYVIRPADAGLGLDAAASVAPAFGHTWNPLELVGRFLGGETLPAVAAVDEAALAEQVSAIADAIDVAPIEPTLTFDGTSPVLDPGTAGRALDEAATQQALVDAVLRKRSPIQATVVKVEPDADQQAQQEAIAFARAAVSGPVEVTAGTVTAEIPARAIADALSFTATDGRLEPSLDGAVLHASIKKELAPIEVKGRDATFKIRKGVPRVVPSKVGRGVSDEELSTSVVGVLDKEGSARAVTVDVGVREPSLTTEEAAQLGVTEKLGSFTQAFPYAAYRVQNIGEAARRVNGTLLMPGDTFSMNDTIGERTEKNGYTVGFVIGSGGVFDEALGGGVSTATTAVWTAAFYSGLERVQTVAHSIYISRYKPGLEATVAWGIFDMKFRNDTPNAVFITAGITNSSVTVSMWGTKVYDEVKSESGPRTNIKPFDTIYDKSKTCLGQEGVDGFTIVVDRVFYKDGAEVRREPITTTYKPAPKVVCGKKPDKPKPDKPGASASPSPSPSDGVAAEGDTFTNVTPSPSPAKPSGKPSAKPSAKPSPSATRSG